MGKGTPTVVIAGAGYAGLAAYLALRAHARAGRLRVIVVNADNWHVLVPELPLYLAGDEPGSELRMDLRRAVQPPAELVVARVAGLETGARRVVCAGGIGPIGGDALILALGSVSSDFGVPGVARHALAIGRWHDAQEMRARVLADLEARAQKKVAVVGAGFTGVEIAAALAERAIEAGSPLHVALIGDHVLPAMPGDVRRVGESALRRLGIELVADRAQAVDAGMVRLEHGPPHRADTIIWAAGVRANPVLGSSGLPVNGRGQVRVDGYLRVAPRVYCAGDCAAVPDPHTRRDAAPTAQLALQEGPAAACNAVREMDGRPLVPFQPKERGFLVSLGRREAAGTIAGASVHGGDVAALKRMIERYHAFQVGGLRALARGLLRGQPTEARADRATARA